jgi:hypothetical protein
MAPKHFAEDFVVVAERDRGCVIPWEGFGDLPRQPFRGWMLGNSDMNDLASQVPQHDQCIEPVMVGVVKRSMDTMSARWLRKNVRQP